MRTVRIALIFAALLLLYDGVFSYLASCDHVSGYAGADRHYSEDCSAFRGPIVTGVHFALSRFGAFSKDHGEAFPPAFMAVLAVSTLLLWRSTERLSKAGERQMRLARAMSLRQSRELQASIDIASRAAAAAELNARTAVAARLPRVMLSKAELLQPVPATGPGNGKTAGNGVPPARSQIEMTFANVGETPAFVTGHCIEYVVAGRLPPDPTYRTTVPDAAGTMIEPNTAGNFRIADASIKLTQEQIRDLQKNKKNKLWIYGFLAFTDFMDQPHERRFCLRWSHHPDGPTGLVPEPDAPAEYTRSGQSAFR
jgi:hypothetical protein